MAGLGRTLGVLVGGYINGMVLKYGGRGVSATGGTAGKLVGNIVFGMIGYALGATADNLLGGNPLRSQGERRVYGSKGGDRMYAAGVANTVIGGSFNGIVYSLVEQFFGTTGEIAGVVSYMFARNWTVLIDMSQMTPAATTDSTPPDGTDSLPPGAGGKMYAGY